MFVDGHLDLAYNALRFNRDLTRPVTDVRAAESHLKSHPNGVVTTSFPTLREGGFGIVFGSLFCLPRHLNRELPGNERLTYTTTGEAHRAAVSQLDYYRRLADEVAWIRLVGSRDTLDEVINSWQETEGERLLGVVPLMEGADPVREPEELEMWAEMGVRIIGPAWDDTRYAAGAWRGGGGFTDDGRQLMEIMADLGMILDITHLSKEASLEALERYPGNVVATHCNARAIVDGKRHLGDDQIRLLAERDGVVGIVLYNRFLKQSYAKSDRKESVTVADVAAHIDHVCQLVGTAAHVGIGSDLDGGFGRQDAPAEIDSCADVGTIGDALRERGYDEADVASIMGENWLRVLRS